MVDDFFFINGCADLSDRFRVLLEIIPDGLFLTGELTCPLDNALADFLIEDFYASLFTHFGKDQTEANAPCAAGWFQSMLVLTFPSADVALAKGTSVTQSQETTSV